MLLALKNFKQPYNIGVPNLLEQVNFLKNLSLAKVIFHEGLFYSFDCYLLSSQNMNTKRHFAKCALADQFYELVKLKRSRWQLIRLLDVVLDVSHQLFNLLCAD